MYIPYDEDARRAPAGRGVHPAPGVGLRRTPRPTSTRCCCTSRTSTCTASRSSSRPTWCWPCSCAATDFTAEQKARNFDYYEPLTVRDSSLSACTQAVMAAEVGHLGLAYDYLGEAAFMDLQDLEHNTRDGVHIASLAGTWIALVGGFGGLRHAGRRVQFRAASARRAHPAGVHPAHPGAAAAGGGQPTPRARYHAGGRRPDGDRPPRHSGEATAGKPEERADPAHTAPPAAQPAARAGADSTR